MSIYDASIEDAIAAARRLRDAPRITPADIEANIDSEHYFTASDGVQGAAKCDITAGPLDRLTFCVIVLRNGHRVVGINYGAIDPKQHSAAMGRSEARKDAVNKVYEFLAYELRTTLSIIDNLKESTHGPASA
jgi:Phage protein (N4 Gp49/phage Sf6 gene 66) family